MMDDRELLTLAAKAAGIELEGWYESADAFNAPHHGWWNPLTDDGDAFRLAVKVGGELRLHTEENWSAFGVIYSDEGMFEYHNNDPYAATRRAIVRAAAEIGRNME